MALFPHLLGAGFCELPVAVRRIHDGSPKVAEGTASVDRAPGLWPWLICTVAGLPVTGRKVPVTVNFSVDAYGRERWRRQFASRRYGSTLAAGPHPNEVVEYFGPFTLFHRVTVQPGGLQWVMTAWRLLGIPLPKWSTLATNVIESEDDGRFTFAIDVAFPFIGHVISYSGWLAVQQP